LFFSHLLLKAARVCYVESKKIEIVNQDLAWVAWVKETYSFKNERPQVLNLQLLLLQQELSNGRD
jgi:hypothetical protein